MKYIATHIPPPNDQRTDPDWDWKGIRIKGNSQCQGNSAQDVLVSLAMEFNLKDLIKIDTFGYYAIFFGWLEHHRPDDITRDDMMTWTNHAEFIQYIIRSNKLPVQVQCYSSIGDRKRKGDTIDIQPFNGNASFLHMLCHLTGRPLSIGTLILPSGHYMRIHASDDVNKEFERNDPFGTYPYRTAAEKNQVSGIYSWRQLQDAKIRRVIAIEDLH